MGDFSKDLECYNSDIGIIKKFMKVQSDVLQRVIEDVLHDDDKAWNLR